MRLSRRKLLLYVATSLLLLVIVFLGTWPIISGRLYAKQGPRQARIDIQNGYLRYMYMGHQKRWNLAAAHELKEQYGIEMTFTRTIDGYEQDYWRGYNRTVKDYLIQKHLRDVIGEVFTKHHKNQ